MEILPPPNNLSGTIVKKKVTVKSFFLQKRPFLRVFLFFFGDICEILSKIKEIWESSIESEI